MSFKSGIHIDMQLSLDSSFECYNLTKIVPIHAIHCALRNPSTVVILYIVLIKFSLYSRNILSFSLDIVEFAWK